MEGFLDAISQQHVWSQNSGLLANWCWQRMVNRTDRYGGYYINTHGKPTSVTKPADGAVTDSLTIDTLIRHFRDPEVEDIVALHALSADSKGKWVAIDLDAHEGTDADPEKNLTYIKDRFHQLSGLGFHPLLLSSDGIGGYHLFVLFDQAIEGTILRRFGEWLTQGTQAEVFPKQPVIHHGKFGSYLRLPGRHHKRDHWSRVYNGDQWLSGQPAIDYILSLTGDSQNLIPDQSLVSVTSTKITDFPRSQHNKRPGDDFNHRGTWEQTGLFDAGWVISNDSSGVRTLTRPGKSSGTSAMIAPHSENPDLELFHVFSSNADPFEADQSYTKFSVFTILNHDRNYHDAARYLATSGFGSQSPILSETTSHKSSQASTKPLIFIDVDEFRVSDEALCALEADDEIFQRGSYLVEILTVSQSDCGIIIRPIETPQIRVIPPANLRERLTRVAQFVRTRSNQAEPQPAHPPPWCVQSIVARENWPNLRQLDGLITYPVILTDGSILARRGYHPQAKLYLYVDHQIRIEIPDMPTCEDVDCSLKILYDIIIDFPFASEAHRSSWLAALLTPLASYAFSGPSPLFFIDGNIRGIGKGLLADVISIILTGKRFPTMQYSADSEELRKSITAFSRSGDRIVLFDNVSGGFGNSVLDSALTSKFWQDRLLGENKNYTGPLDVVWYATGNNVQLGSDMSRRVCPIRMETYDEQPELKSQFRYPDLRSHVLSNRSNLLSAALTVLRYWFVSGKPNRELSAWGSYEGWSGVIRQTIVHAGQPDPAETRIIFQTHGDHEKRLLEIILDGLRQLDSTGRGMTTSEIINRVSMPHADQWVQELRSAIEELCGKLEPSKLGYKFRSAKHRNVGGLMLDQTDTERGSYRWKSVSAARR